MSCPYRVSPDSYRKKNPFNLRFCWVRYKTILLYKLKYFQVKSGHLSSIFGIVQRICAIYQHNCAKNGKGLKVGTKEADTICIKYRVGGISKD